MIWIISKTYLLDWLPAQLLISILSLGKSKALLLYLPLISFVDCLLHSLSIMRVFLLKRLGGVSQKQLFSLPWLAAYFIGEHKGNPEGALQCVSFITYSVFYFYGVNILRNIKEILPNSSNGYKVVAFLHYVLSVEFIKNIPYLTNYLQKGNTK